MIPKNLTVVECGALLIVVGQRMMDHNVTADVVLDLSTYADPSETLDQLVHEIDAAEPLDTISRARAEELLQVTLEEAITFNPADT